MLRQGNFKIFVLEMKIVKEKNVKLDRTSHFQF